MSYELVARAYGDTCTLKERASGAAVTSEVTLQAPKRQIIDTMKLMLADPNSMDAENGNVRVARRRDELWMTVGIATVPLKWQHVFPMVLEDA